MSYEEMDHNYMISIIQAALPKTYALSKESPLINFGVYSFLNVNKDLHLSADHIIEQQHKRIKELENELLHVRSIKEGLV